ncbi:hypothetical protein NP493_729g01046 [Ridgeia piscesae]|uniref:Uncharacterized protein n=1 Tax=Ridgeia piscesae TaxID=27915 RepID=A0AAD9KQH6_RIDPI|nr:hypothetical protein NP493_729g01046 [Ridgeia piscesae]
MLRRLSTGGFRDCRQHASQTGKGHRQDGSALSLCRYYNLTCTAQFAGAGNISISQVRGYAKKGGGRRDKGKKDGKPAVNLSPEELNEIVNFEKMKNPVDMALEHMKQEYYTQLTIRNTSGAFDNLAVETYLIGSHFTVHTDNINPLSYIQTSNLGATELRWVAQLAQFDYEIKYRSGRCKANADALSRKT